MDRVIFGDNQFFGVDHLSQENSRKKEQRFKDTGEILKVLDAAHEVGIRTFMCTTYSRIGEICDHFRSNPAKYADWKIYPCMPYAHKYANAVTELGITGALNRFTGGNVMEGFIKGGAAVVQRDAFKIMQMLVDAEMAMFQGTNTEVIFLQNVVTDLLMGLGMDEFFLHYADYVASKYGAKPGFITMNLPLAAERLHRLGIEKPIICASLNKIGFRMTGGIEANEKALLDGEVRGIAMQALAAGALRPREAMEYVCGLKGVESILFGASSHSHIEETYHLIEELSD
ncbi:hypothetical protein F0M18_12820 [Pseudohalioglobus sediminis]|uniref:Uncharacterized protein n=1 Tax=Pseudohalioglobus sediminis TaxID=2606449 RepID=A0A5B0WSU0_9GAMM|nr:hypothetical protein [Pseudohalioglobus sediminis]KAA1190130.1 hypothetical protein F0M18_12820 [Pseudohalioglobus sediminis]